MRTTLARLSALLSEGHLQQAVDAPLRSAVSRFSCALTPPSHAAQFNQVLTRFVQHVYLEGLRLPLRLSNEEALGEAVMLIEHGFPGPPGSRYEAALVQATHPETDGLAWLFAEAAQTALVRGVNDGSCDSVTSLLQGLACVLVEGLLQVLLWLAEAIRQRERHQYLLWIVASTLDPTDRQLRCALVATLRRERPDLFPAGLGTLSAAELANHTLQLLAIDGELSPCDATALDWFGL